MQKIHGEGYRKDAFAILLDHARLISHDARYASPQNNYTVMHILYTSIKYRLLLIYLFEFFTSIQKSLYFIHNSFLIFDGAIFSKLLLVIYSQSPTNFGELMLHFL